MALSKLDTDFLEGMLKAHEMETAAAQKFIQMADETSDRSVVDLAYRMINKIAEASDKIRAKLENGASTDPRAAVARAMDEVAVMSNGGYDDDLD